MCNPTTKRTIAIQKRPAVDVAHLLTQVNALKAQNQRPTLPTKPAVSVVEVTEEPSGSANKKRNRHYTVQHNYHDHANDNRADYQEEHPARGGVTTQFPLKLHEMLDLMSADGKDDIISWQPHGRCFLIHKPKEFAEILPKYFKLSKVASFQRQLNLYGFQRLTQGRDRGGYYHELFLRNRVYLSHAIQRIKVKGTGVRARSNPDQEPDFWSMPWVTENGLMPPQSSQQPPSTFSLPVPVYESSFKFSQPQNFQCAPQPDDDVIMSFGSKTFHYLDPYQSTESQPVQTYSIGSNDLLDQDAEAFFEDFEFPDCLGNELEDDSVFGSLLEQMIS